MGKKKQTNQIAISHRQTLHPTILKQRIKWCQIKATKTNEAPKGEMLWMPTKTKQPKHGVNVCVKFMQSKCNKHLQSSIYANYSTSSQLRDKADKQ